MSFFNQKTFSITLKIKIMKKQKIELKENQQTWFLGFTKWKNGSIKLFLCFLLVAITQEIISQTAGLWRGYDDEDWNNPINWDNGIVPDNTVDVVITTSTVNYPIIRKKLVVGSTYVPGNIYRCKSLEIQQWTRIDSEDSLWVNGNMTIAGLYLYTEQWLSGTHVINAGGTLNITSAGSVFIGQYGFPEEMKQDLIINAGGTMINAGYLNINDCLVIHAGATFTMSGNEAYIMGWEGNYNATFPGSFYVEAGAIGGVSGGNFHVQGKEKTGYYAFHINEPSFDFTGTSLLHLHCNSDQEMPYPDFSCNTVAGFECWDLAVENLGSITTFYGELKVNNDVNIESPSSVTIAPGATIVVASDFYLKTDISAAYDFYSTLIDYGQLTVNGETQMQWALTGQRWQLVASPVADETALVFNGMYLQSFSETSNQWSDITSSGYVLQKMTGYAAWFDDYWNQGVYFTGIFNNGSIGQAGNITCNNQGWNLVGNPYPSTIDWDAATGWTKTNINNAIYSENNGNWATYINGVGTNGGSRYIPPCQGFFVKATSNPATLVMDNRVRVHNKPLFMKESKGGLVRLTASCETETGVKTDETVVRIDENATAGFDGNFDAYKLFATDKEYPQIYTSPYDLSVSTIPQPKEVQVKFSADKSGNYSIAATEITELPQIILTDLLTNVTTDLNTRSYDFYHEDSNPAGRFVLRFGSATISESTQDEYFDIFTYESSLKICPKNATTLNGNNKEIQVSVTDLLGRKVLELNSNMGQTIKMRNNVKGLSIVTVTWGKIIQEQKVFIY